MNTTDTMHYGYTVDLSIADARAALTDCRCRLVAATPAFDTGGQNVEIMYAGEWMILARTDLKDDVGTGRSTRGLTAQQFVDKMRKAVWFGARIRHYEHGTFFAVVDAMSDG